MQMLGSRGGMGGGTSDMPPDVDERPSAPARSGSAKPAGSAQKPAGKFDDLEDDIPF